MKKIFYLVAIALCFSMAATSCKKDNKKDSSIEDLGGGIYKVNGHRFVDLGLPSGLLWAETNLGASEATAAGDYFAWGETATKTNFTEDNYKFGKDSFTKYSDVDGKQTLESSDDAAVAAWKKPCRMPLDSEFKELLENTTATWTTKNDVKGYEFKSKTNSNSIFLPATKYDDSHKQGDYWTASMTVPVSGPMDYSLATYFQGKEGYSGIGGGVDRYYGNSIRPVASRK